MKILLIWELGRGHGHQFQLEWLAQALKSRQHHVKILGPEQTGYQQFFQITQQGPAHKSWSDLLLINGFSNPAFVASRLQFWQTLFEQEKPDAVIVDHAPYAHLCAYARSIPCMEFGSAFTLPPPGNPVGLFDNAAPPYSENSLMENIQQGFAELNWRQLPNLEALYSYSGIRCATGIPLLDHYGPRTNIAYTGAFAAGSGTAVEWGESAHGKLKLFIYWREGAGLADFLNHLNPDRICVRAYIPQNAGHLPSKKGWIISSQPWNLNSFTAQTLPDLAIGYASNAFIQWMAHLGVPQIMAPVYREGLMQGARAQELGLGLLSSHSRADDIADKFFKLIQQPSFRQNAANFSCYSHEEWNAAPRLSALCQLIERTLQH